MRDIIALTCPSCGGKLEVGAQAVTLVCKYCGNQHLVRRDGDAVTLESYARCPLCGRNDRAEKVTAIRRSQTQTLSTTEHRAETYIDASGQMQTRTIEVPVTREQTSDLARQLVPPERPSPAAEPLREADGNLHMVGIAVAGFSCLLCFGVVSSSQIDTSSIRSAIETLAAAMMLVSLWLIVFCIGGVLVYLGYKKVSTAAAAYKNAVDAVRAANEKAEMEWHRAMERWNKLYYCHRDDCVFIPEEGGSAPLPEMRKYLYERKK